MTTGKKKQQPDKFISAAKEHDADLDEPIFGQAVKLQPAKKKTEKDEREDQAE